ncbi:hypothetical protein D9757_012821 [Collybiopsis confluens]|uniref:Uncharacterized protein n=1 Tax=Collybiopsis confluens TaxID=2823264 RepID=A0A8H5D8Q2_9AGAR|nr:hypothetical protein D9757_012821 [Collybiopsis confluens]
MPNLPFDMSPNPIEILAQHVVSGLNAFAQKIGVQDDEPMLERLRRGEYRLAPSSLSEINPLFEEGVSRLVELDQSIAKIEDAMQRLKRTRTCFEGSSTIAASLFAPIRRVPEDVLVEIFSLYIEDQEEYSFSLTTYDTASGNLAPSIRKLSLHAHFDNEEVLDFVRSQPSIDELTLKYYKSRSEGTVSLKDVLSYLTLSQLEDPQNTALVPNLRRLIIEIFYPDYSFQTLPTLARDISEMVKSRASAGDRPPGDAGLQAFQLRFFAQDCVQDLFSEICVLLAPLVTSGLQLRLDTC